MVKNIIAVGYVRCSTEMQEDSPEQQKKEILQYAEQQGYKIVEWFIDFGKSGTTFDQRPEFQRLRERVDNKPNFGVVVCYDESRWGRAIDAEENTFWRVYFRKRGVDVVLVKTSVDRKNDFAPMLSAFEGVQASQYSKKLSELTLRGAKNNGKYSSGGTAPYGYIRVAENLKTGVERILADGDWCIPTQEKVKWIIGSPDEVETVRFIFKERAMGKACVVIAKILNDRKIHCPKRGRWRNKNSRWSDGTIKCIIENPTYYGVRIYNRNSMSKIQAQQKGRNLKDHVSYPHWQNEKSDWVVVENAHPPIIDKALWEKANSINKSTKISSSRPRHLVPYLLTGLIKCARCGFPYQGQSTGIKGKKYFRYICGGYNSKRICAFYSVLRDPVESFVLNAIQETLGEPLLVDKITEKLQSLIVMQPNYLAGEIERIKNLMEETETKIGNLLSAIEQVPQSDSIIQRLQDLERERNDLEVNYNSLKRQNLTKEDVDNLSVEVQDFVVNFERDISDAPIHEKKLLVKKCISNIEVDPESNVVRVFVRRLPAVNQQIEELLNQVEKRKTAPLLEEPFRNVEVAGDRTIHYRKLENERISRIMMGENKLSITPYLEFMTSYRTTNELNSKY